MPVLAADKLTTAASRVTATHLRERTTDITLINADIS